VARPEARRAWRRGQPRPSLRLRDVPHRQHATVFLSRTSPPHQSSGGPSRLSTEGNAVTNCAGRRGPLADRRGVMIHQRAAVGLHGGRQAGQLVAAFQQRNHSALGILIGNFQEDPRQLLEILVRQPQPAQRIAQPRIGSRRKMSTNSGFELCETCPAPIRSARRRRFPRGPAPAGQGR